MYIEIKSKNKNKYANVLPMQDTNNQQHCVVIITAPKFTRVMKA